MPRAEGCYYLVDRKNNMIISGGENVYPSEVENLLGAHLKVKDVAVIGRPDAKWGESVHAVIVLRDGVLATEREILDWCIDRIAGYKRPRSVSFLREEAMPRTAMGKILHRVLRDRILRRGQLATRVASSPGMPALARVRRQRCRLGLDHCFDRSVDHCHGLDCRRRCGQRFRSGPTRPPVTGVPLPRQQLCCGGLGCDLCLPTTDAAAAAPTAGAAAGDVGSVALPGPLRPRLLSARPLGRQPLEQRWS